ncbi:hypothetical protein C1T17_16290 [Sphingobium sp. SCG-1]|uniref:hypothetical protein n=1 Tax=Sphingobium sp. SCG-1 TaxID=2072936 RepID=UPI000CD68CDA|nr:hypothetical protein [Sphingobium sp. SCG-1]AUW59413.1 hypothetical protein C1T17_16290 [Sphingobium sp. SCG-1]
MKASPELWQAVATECTRRNDAWARAIDAAEDPEQRWKRAEQMNSDMLLWHRIAIIVAKRAPVEPEQRDALLREARPLLPATAADWEALPATVRKTLDQAIQRGADDMIRDLHPLWRWLHLLVYVWTIPTLHSASTDEPKRNAA